MIALSTLTNLNETANKLGYALTMGGLIHFYDSLCEHLFRQTKETWSLDINSLPNNPNFLPPKERRLWKTPWEKEKMLVTSIF